MHKSKFFSILSVSLALALAGCGAPANTGSTDAAATTDATPSSPVSPASITASPQDGPFTSALNPRRNYLVTVNKAQPYVFGGEYDRALAEDLIEVGDAETGEPTRVEKGAYLAFTQLQTALGQKGVFIGLYSAYRTEGDQQWVYDTYHDMPGWNDETTQNEVSLPGHSEHHTGLMIEYVLWRRDDAGKWEVATITAENKTQYPEYEIIKETLPEYGFILRYPAERADTTGIGEEPYELRFVGSVKIAKEITEKGLALEEYYLAVPCS